MQCCTLATALLGVSFVTCAQQRVEVCSGTNCQDDDSISGASLLQTKFQVESNVTSSLLALSSKEVNMLKLAIKAHSQVIRLRAGDAVHSHMNNLLNKTDSELVEFATAMSRGPEGKFFPQGYGYVMGYNMSMFEDCAAKLRILSKTECKVASTHFGKHFDCCNNPHPNKSYTRDMCCRPSSQDPKGCSYRKGIGVDDIYWNNAETSFKHLPYQNMSAICQVAKEPGPMCNMCITGFSLIFKTQDAKTQACGFTSHSDYSMPYPCADCQDFLRAFCVQAVGYNGPK